MGISTCKKSNLSMMNRISSMLFIIAATLLCSVNINAQVPGDVFESGGIKYKVWSTNHNTVHIIPPLGSYYDLADVVIPEKVNYKGTSFTVTKIEDYAFTCSTITSVVIPGSVKEIGSRAFSDCLNLADVTFNEGLEKIGTEAFWETAISEISIPESLTIVEDHVFSHTPWYENLPKGENYLGNLFYIYKTQGNEFIMPENTTIVLKDGTKGICGNAFLGQKNMVDIVIPNSVVSIGRWAFDGCTNLNISSFPESITYCGFEAIDDLPLFKKATSDIIYVGKVLYSCKSATVSIKEGTTMIAASAFKENRGIREIVMPNSIKVLGEEAFTNCSGLKKVHISDSVKLIEGRTFSNANSITDLKLPKCLEEIKYKGFSVIACRDFVIPEELNFIDSSNLIDMRGTENIKVDKNNKRFCDVDGVMFSKDMKELVRFPTQRGVNYVVPDGTVSIADHAFERGNIYSLKIPASVTKLGFACMAANNNYLTSVIFEEPADKANALTEIPKDAFKFDSNLDEIKLPSTIKCIESGAFQFCSKITDIAFADSAEYIGVSAFEGTGWFDAQPDGVVYINDLAYDFKGETVSDVVIKDGTKKINDYLGLWNEKVKSVTIPASVKYIGSGAFRGTSLETVTGGENAIINSFAFSLNPWYDSHADGLVYHGVNLLGYKGTLSEFTEIKIKEGTEVINLFDNKDQTVSMFVNAVEIPESAKYIGIDFFLDLQSQKITLKTPVPPIPLTYDYKEFKINILLKNNCIVYVPPYGLEAYRKHPVWGQFCNIVADPSSVENIETSIETADNIRVFADGGNIVVEGVEEGTPVEVFNLNGQRIYSGVETLISVPARGIYIVRVDGKSYKIIK